MNIRLIAASVALFLPLCGYGMILFKSPIPYDIVDRDNSGIVSIFEALDSLDVGEREIDLNSRNCIEYYWLKDGLPAHINCTQS